MFWLRSMGLRAAKNHIVDFCELSKKKSYKFSLILLNLEIL